VVWKPAREREQLVAALLRAEELHEEVPSGEAELHVAYSLLDQVEELGAPDD
jgi:hypothetical protein